MSLKAEIGGDKALGTLGLKIIWPSIGMLLCMECVTGV